MPVNSSRSIQPTSVLGKPAYNMSCADHSSHSLFSLLRRLEDAKIHFTLARHREDTVLVTMTLVGERVEVDVFADGHMEVSRFPGNEDVVGDAELVQRLIDENGGTIPSGSGS